RTRSPTPGRSRSSPSRPRPSAADRRHRPVRVEEPRVVDPVTDRFAGHRREPALGELVVPGAGPESGAEAGPLPREETVPDLAVRGEPDAVAVAAERAGDRRDHADRGRAAVDEEEL